MCLEHTHCPSHSHIWKPVHIHEYQCIFCMYIVFFRWEHAIFVTCLFCYLHIYISFRSLPRDVGWEVEVRGHQRGHIKLRRCIVYSLCPLHVVFGQNGVKWTHVMAPSRGKTKDRGRTVCEAQPPPPCFTGCWKQGAHRKWSWGLLSHINQEDWLWSWVTLQRWRGERTWKNPNRRLWLICTVGIASLHLASARHKMNISRIKNKYFGPSLGNVKSTNTI